MQFHFKRHIGHTNVFFVQIILRLLLGYDLMIFTWKVQGIFKFCQFFEGIPRKATFAVLYKHFINKVLLYV